MNSLKRRFLYGFKKVWNFFREKPESKRAEGFTYVETVAVIAIGAVLTAGSVFSAARLISAARKKAAKTQIARAKLYQ